MSSACRSAVRSPGTALAVIALGSVLLLASAAPASANSYRYLNERARSKTDSAGNCFAM
jgi:hypothetical protein